MTFISSAAPISNKKHTVLNCNAYVRAVPSSWIRVSEDGDRLVSQVVRFNFEDWNQHGHEHIHDSISKSAESCIRDFHWVVTKDQNMASCHIGSSFKES